jgi:hypothetical protein
MEDMTPFQSARAHLPQLAAEWSTLKATFGPGVTLEYLTTPDGTWGTDETEGWPRVRADQLGGQPDAPRGRGSPYRRKCSRCGDHKSMVGGRTFAKGQKWHCRECR